MNLEPGVKANEYQWAKLILALPISIVLLIYLKLVQLTLIRPLPRFPVEKLPSSIFIYAYHRVFYFFHASRGMQARGDKAIVWLAYHGFASYFPFALTIINRYRFLRFYFSKSVRPLDQVKQFLEEHSNEAFGLLTDAGGPYHRVRRSVFDLSQQTKRPVIAMSLRCSRAFKWGIHEIPLPFSKIELSLSRVFEPGEIAALGRDKATDLFQQAIDRL